MPAERPVIPPMPDEATNQQSAKKRAQRGSARGAEARGSNGADASGQHGERARDRVRAALRSTTGPAGGEKPADRPEEPADPDKSASRREQPTDRTAKPVARAEKSADRPERPADRTEEPASRDETGPAGADSDSVGPTRRTSASTTSQRSRTAGRTGSAAREPHREEDTRALPVQRDDPMLARRQGRPRRAHLRLVHVDPWSVMKTSFLLSIAFGIVCVVAVAIVWAVLSAAGVWDSVNTMVQDTIGNDSTKPFDVTDYVGTSRVIGFTMLVAVVDVVLITAIATLGAFVYNLAATLLGGVEVTMAEDR